MSTKEPLSKSAPEESLKVMFAEVFQQISRRPIKPEVQVSFYPFAGLNNTIRIRNQRVYVRVSDILCDAPQAVHRALAHILVGKLFKQRPKVEHETLYRQFIYQPQILRASDLARQRRGRKQLSGSVGRTYNLDRIFTQLNRRYFDNDLYKPNLSWSMRRTKRILGHHDAVHDAIIISRSLDLASVPDYVVEYVMYHEMLHVKHKPRLVNGRRLFHTPAFRAEEKRFAYYDEAIKWLEHSSQRRR
jgi:predicted metal-dependent hydrolase